METNSKEVIEINVRELFAVLLHKSWIIILFGIIGTACAVLASKYLLEPVYTSSTMVYLISRQDDNKISYSDIQTGTQLTKDYMILVKSRPVTEQVIKNLNLNFSNEQLSQMIEVSTPQDTRILKITVNNQNPDMAKKLADEVARVSSERIVSIMEMDKVNVVEQANTPKAPSSPNIIKNASLGGMAGALLSAFFIAMIYLMNDSIRTMEDIEKYLGITSLGMVPFLDNKYYKKEKKHSKKETIFAD